MTDDERVAHVKIGVEKYISLNGSCAHKIEEMIDLLKEKKIFVYKQNLALKRLQKALEKDDRIGISLAWRDVQHWGSRAKLIHLTDKDYAASDPPFTQP